MKNERFIEKWYVVYTYPKHEKKVEYLLNQKGFQTFLPLVKVQRVWSDRKKLLVLPLFPSYIFVKTNPGCWSKVLSISGVSRLVSFEGNPSIIPESEIELIKDIISNGSNFSIEDKIKKDEKIRVLEGAFSGYEGVVLESQKGKRLSIFIETLGKIISFDLSSINYEKVQKV